MRIHVSKGFEEWLATQRVSLAISTYTAGKLMTVGRKSAGGIALSERSFDRCMGLWSDGQTLFAATAFQIWRFENILRSAENDFDRLYVPRIGYTTGDINVHDMAFVDDRLWFVTSMFSSLATLSKRDSFLPEWRPPFITRLTAENRCHLNGLAIKEGLPYYATAVAETDTAGGWREHRKEGGVVIDIGANQVIARGLCMPRSPRWHDGKLWLLNAGRGQLGYLDQDRFIAMTFLPGYARGLTMIGDYAVVGVSRPRNHPTFSGLPLEEALVEHGTVAKCGVFIVNLHTGEIEHSMQFANPVNELYDVVTLPYVRRAKALGFGSEDIRYTVSVEGAQAVWNEQA